MHLLSREKLPEEERKRQAAVAITTDELRRKVDNCRTEIKQRTEAVRAAEKEGSRLVSNVSKALANAERTRQVAFAGNIRVFETEVKTPQGIHPLDEAVSFSVESAGNMSVTRRLTLTRAAVLGPFSLFTPKATKHDARELYFIAEHPNWTAVAAVNPNAGVGARQAAAAANLAARQSTINRKSRQATIAAARRGVEEAQAEADATKRQAQRALLDAHMAFVGVRDFADRLRAQLESCEDLDTRTVRRARKAVDDALKFAQASEQSVASASAEVASDSRPTLPTSDEASANITAGQTASSVIVLTDAGDKKIRVIKAIRAYTGWGLRETKAFVDHVPGRLEGVDRVSADTLVAELTAAGASVEVRPVHIYEGAPRDGDPSAGPDGDVIGRLERLAALRASGAIEEEEFQALKAQLLNEDERPSP